MRPADPRTPDQRAARRAVIKAHHPDRGGDPDHFVLLLDAIDRTGGVDPESGHTRGLPSRRGVRRRRTVLALRARLPRSTPGARRYATY